MNNFLTVSQICKLYKVGRRPVVNELRSGNWGAQYVLTGAHKQGHGWRAFNPPTFDPVMLPKDLARIMGVSHQIIIRWCTDGKIKAFRIGTLWRIYYDDGARMIFKRQFGYTKEIK